MYHVNLFHSKRKYTTRFQIIKVISLTHSSNLSQTTSSETFPIKYIYQYRSNFIRTKTKREERRKNPSCPQSNIALLKQISIVIKEKSSISLQGDVEMAGRT